MEEELRKGNYVTIAHESNEPIKQIKSFYENGIHVGLGETHPFNLVLPIKLTEEWCNRFEYSCLQELVVDMIHNAKHPISDNISLWVATISALPVHKLQNLFYTLTWRELIWHDISTKAGN